jgi:hypothetical protein
LKTIASFSFQRAPVVCVVTFTGSAQWRFCRRILTERTRTRLGHTRSSAEEISQDDQDDCDNQEDLSEIRRKTRDATEPKKRGYNGNDSKDNRPAEHLISPSE